MQHKWKALDLHYNTLHYTTVSFRSTDSASSRNVKCTVPPKLMPTPAAGAAAGAGARLLHRTQ